MLAGRNESRALPWFLKPAIADGEGAAGEVTGGGRGHTEGDGGGGGLVAKLLPHGHSGEVNDYNTTFGLLTMF